MNLEYRYAVVAACKWVDEVVPNAPYYTSVDVLDRYNCDFCVHGDDITTTADGVDCYKEVKEAGRYQECKRTIGISTTELVGRMLLMTRDHHTVISEDEKRQEQSVTAFSSAVNKAKQEKTTVSRFFPTSRRIVQFSEGKEPKVSSTEPATFEYVYYDTFRKETKWSTLTEHLIYFIWATLNF